MQRLRYLTVLLSLVLSLTSVQVIASGDLKIRLEPVKINLRDTASIKRGAKYFATQCMVCHAMQFLEYDKIARGAGLTIDKMPVKDQEWWFGAAPPDLSLIARVRSPRWIYTYLHSFYKDSETKLGSNNLLVHNSRMPNPFAGLQGEQVLAVCLNEEHKMAGEYARKPRYFSVLRMEKQGSLAPEEFHKQVYDIVNFLVYASEPARLQRMALGWWVLGFLLILMVLAYLLKKEYWKSIK